MKTIFIDSREKSRAIQLIQSEFDQCGIKHFSTKLFVGDYMNPDHPLIFIDRKQNIAEIAQNATSGNERLKNELRRLTEINGKMYFLIEQAKIDNKPITCLEDIILWEPKYGNIMGERVFKVLSAWKYKYNVEFIFCERRATGKEIIRLLGGSNE